MFPLGVKGQQPPGPGTLPSQVRGKVEVWRGRGWRSLGMPVMKVLVELWRWVVVGMWVKGCL